MPGVSISIAPCSRTIIGGAPSCAGLPVACADGVWYQTHRGRGCDSGAWFCLLRTSPRDNRFWQLQQLTDVIQPDAGHVAERKDRALDIGRRTSAIRCSNSSELTRSLFVRRSIGSICPSFAITRVPLQPAQVEIEVTGLHDQGEIYVDPDHLVVDFPAGVFRRKNDFRGRRP